MNLNFSAVFKATERQSVLQCGMRLIQLNGLLCVHCRRPIVGNENKVKGGFFKTQNPMSDQSTNNRGQGGQSKYNIRLLPGTPNIIESDGD